MKRFIIALIFITLFLNPFAEADIDCRCSHLDEPVHNCRMWAIMSPDIPDSIIYNHLIADPYSIEHLSEVNNVDGWGIAYYPDFGDSAIIERGAIRAHQDPYFDTAVVNTERAEPNIAMAHIRRCSAGCCAHDSDSIPDPHPFIRFKNNKYWTFIHNGAVDKELLYTLIGEDYLQENPPTGSDIPQCDPSDTSLVVDSELFFLLLMKNIEENSWNVADGLIDALVQINLASYSEAMNFILTDGYSIWSYCKARSLYYLDNQTENYLAIASQYPTQQQGDWVAVHDNQLLIKQQNEQLTILNLCDYLPSIAGTITDQEGLPIGNVDVLTIGKPWNNRTGDDGNYLLECLSLGSYNFRYSHAYYADTLIENIEIDDADQDIIRDVVLRYPASLNGIVVNAIMEPVPNVRVMVRNTTGRTYTDMDGYYTIDSLNPGYFQVSFSHPYYTDTSLFEIGLIPDSTTTINMELRNPACVTGEIADSAGNPVNNVRVSVIGTARRDYTGPDGTFMIDSLDAGTYSLMFYNINYKETTLADLNIPPGDTLNIDLTLTFLGYAYLPGDVNMFYGEWPSQRIGLDVTYLVNYFKSVAVCQPCSLDGFWASADANGDCQIIGSDVTRLVQFFRNLADLQFCPDFPPRWLTADDLPQIPPMGWPACENELPEVISSGEK